MIVHCLYPCGNGVTSIGFNDREGIMNRWPQVFVVKTIAVVI